MRPPPTAPSPHHRHHQALVLPVPALARPAMPRPPEDAPKRSQRRIEGLAGIVPSRIQPTYPQRGVATLTCDRSGGARRGDQEARRATSVAQYVRMTLAPARRMAVRVSMMALSRSTQPLAAAASTIANSPL